MAHEEDEVSQTERARIMCDEARRIAVKSGQRGEGAGYCLRQVKPEHLIEKHEGVLIGRQQ